jgi:sugar phosphate isomerase/epimerase
MRTGIQVSSLKPILQTEAQVREAFKRMKAMGCTAVQLQWIDPSVSIECIAGALADAGIASVSVQDFYEVIRENKAYYVELNARTGGVWMCVSRVPERLKSAQGLAQYVKELSDFQAELEAVGQKLCFHPVRTDFAPIEGVCPVEYLLAQLPGLSVCLDLYHLNRCGYDMPAWIRRYAGRICMAHFKDGVKDAAGKEQLVPAGQGDVRWDGVVKACVEAGVEYGFVEQEAWTRDPFDCLREADTWLRGQLEAARA